MFSVRCYALLAHGNKLGFIQYVHMDRGILLNEVLVWEINISATQITRILTSVRVSPLWLLVRLAQVSAQTNSSYL